MWLFQCERSPGGGGDLPRSNCNSTYLDVSTPRSSLKGGSGTSSRPDSRCLSMTDLHEQSRKLLEPPQQQQQQLSQVQRDDSFLRRREDYTSNFLKGLTRGKSAKKGTQLPIRPLSEGILLDEGTSPVATVAPILPEKVRLSAQATKTYLVYAHNLGLLFSRRSLCQS